jgi:hypothetical protein
METLILTRSEVEQALSPDDLLDALRDAFAAYSTQRMVNAMRVPVSLPQQRAGASGMLLAPGLVPGIPAYSVKVHAKFPGGNPAIQGVLILHDLDTGAPLAILESSYLTACRTGLAGAEEVAGDNGWASAKNSLEEWSTRPCSSLESPDLSPDVLRSTPALRFFAPGLTMELSSGWLLTKFCRKTRRFLQD